jgi:hypothetical protein
MRKPITAMRNMYGREFSAKNALTKPEVHTSVAAKSTCTINGDRQIADTNHRHLSHNDHKHSSHY